MELRCDLCGGMYATDHYAGGGKNHCPRCEQFHGSASQEELIALRESYEEGRQAERTVWEAQVVEERPPNMTWQRLFLGFEGRIGLKTFWLAAVGVDVGVYAVVGITASGFYTSWAALFVIPIAVILWFWASLAIQVKRWHDRNKAGVWVLVNAFPGFGWVWALVECGFLEGTPGRNDYGMPEKWERK